MIIFSLIHNLIELIQNEQNTVISFHFTNPAEYTRTTSGTIFSAVR